MILGFTGTEKGMRPRQLKAVRQLLYNCDVLHLGDCIGADAEAHAAAVKLGVHTVGHPPSENARRAFCAYDQELDPKPFLVRNRGIAIAGTDGLIATPDGWVEVLRSGTWSTVRYARRHHRRIWIVRPDGSIVEEQN